MITILIGCAAIIAWVGYYIYAMRRNRAPSFRDKGIGVILFGPFYKAVDSTLRKRGFAISTREIVGIIVVILFMFLGPPLISRLLELMSK